MDTFGCQNDDSIGPSVQGCRDDFDFTLKFERIVLSIMPSAVFIALASTRIIYLLRRPAVVDGAWFKFTKLAANAVYAVLELALVALSATKASGNKQLFVASTTLSFIAALFIGPVSLLEHSRSPRPSLLLSVFLALTILFDIAQTRSLWLSAFVADDLVFVKVFTAAVAIRAVVLALESTHKSRWLRWDHKEHSPEESAGLWGLGALIWLNNLFFRGFRSILRVSDLYPLDSNMNAEDLYTLLADRMKQAGPPGRKHGLAKALFKALLVHFLRPVAPRVALACFQFCQPFLIETLLDYLQVPVSESSPNTSYGLIGAALLIYFGTSCSTAFYWYYQERAMYMSRGCLASSVYRKTAQSKLTAADDSAALTLMSTDVERIRIGFLNMHECWINPIEVGVASYLLQRQLGAAFAAPIVVVTCCVFANFFVGKTAGPRQKAWMAKIQKRVGLTANVISNMKHLKISGLTQPVEDSIQELRVSELMFGSRFRMAQANAVMLGFIPLLLAPVITFAVTSKTLDVTTIFTSMSYLLLLTQPLARLFQIVPGLMAGLACLTRIQDFLEKEPRQDFREYASSSSAVGLEKEIETSTTSEAIKIVEGSFGWTEEEFNLKGINATIPRSALTIVVGPIASGKSTLCKVLLGETPYNRGQVIMGTNFGKIGYCDQIPFLSNATIRENIVGFADFDQERYDEAIWATVLGRDLSLFPQGDRSRVGSNGITLSGGQKQRVSIARALYLQSSLLIFDDILSGLDADTEEAVFNRVFGPSGVLKRRNVTVVLCTHSIRHLPNSDHIIALAPDGTLVEEGNFEDLLANQKYVHGLGVKASGAESDSEERPPSISSETAIELARTKTAASATSEVIGTARQVGDTSVYAHYFNSIGAFWMSIFFLNGLLMGFLYNFPTIWLKFWSEDLVSPNPSHGNPFYIGIYTLLQVLTLISFWAAIVIGFRTLIVLSGTVLHKATLRTVMTAPLRFFTTTDSGVVLNFFSQDMTLIDSELPMSLVNFSIDGWIGIGAAAVIATSSPYVAISYPFLLALIYAIQRFYLRTSRQLRLLDLEAKSPLYTHFLDTIKGVATFRAFGWVDKGVIKNANLLDFSQRPAYLLAMIQRWLEFVLNITTMVLAVVVVTLATQLRSSSGFTGASLLSLMTFGEGIANVIRMYTMLETSIGAVARLKTFSEKTIPEDLPGETTIPPPSWPQKGNIEIKGVSASYGEVQEMEEDGETRSTPVLALKDLNLTIEPGQKVAICGRSGSGKSSTILLLVRLLDTLPECAGNMLIDGIPLNTVDRATLRRRIIAVPQDAVFLPDGTSFKTNLDPFNVSTPEECQIVLEAVDLWSFVSQRGGLDEGMTADSLSQGQKQLFSLARAMLRRRVRARELAADVGAGYLEGEKEGEVSKQGGVLLLDEVSSSVDVETDRAMQKIIHKEFEGYTIIMVSHRLEMVMDFDQVIIMDAGTVVESGKPKTLVTSEGSRFRDLWLVGNRE